MNDIATTDGFDIMQVGRAPLTHSRRGPALRAALGGALLAVGTIPRGWLRGALLVSGGYLLFREVTRELIADFRSKRPAVAVRDTVDEASWQSFPASDPPGY